MSLILADRVKETSTTTGTGTIDLDGTATGFQTFVAGVGNTNTVYYCIAHQTADEWETGIGTVTDATPDTLSRDTVLASSNSGSLVNFSAGTMDVFCTIPAARKGAWHLLETQEAINDTTIDFTNYIDDSYNMYVFLLSNVLFTATGNFALLTSSNGGSTFDVSGGNYDWIFQRFSRTAGEVIVKDTNGDSNMDLCENTDTGVSEGLHGMIYLYSPSSTNRTRLQWQLTYANNSESNEHTGIWGTGQRSASALVDAVRFLKTSGNIDEGIFQLFGVK